MSGQTRLNTFCVNIDDVQYVLFNIFILEIISTILIILMTIMICINYNKDCIHLCKSQQTHPTENNRIAENNI